ncbi:uncharacterized protein LOC126844624 [Adelges cooleyi]|uniref:uncharacterized protein LOC126844624 n=1 Tax=Adelges cooleyi TaxID=133065 RepID=UPI00217F40AE|nr:uncharacterized protein LOC126844624 [Adelges cooleyi]
MGEYRQTLLFTSVYLLMFTRITARWNADFFNLERFRENVISRVFVDLLNDFKTLEDDEMKINFGENDIALLSSKNCLSTAKKSEALEKYHKKFEALHCANSLILAWILDNIKALGEGDKTEFGNYKTYVARMLSVLYYGRVIPPVWIILAYSKLVIATDPGSYWKFIEENASCPDGVYTYRDNCKYKNIISKITVETLNVEQFAKELYGNQKLNEAYKYASLFTEENITLAHLTGRQDVLFEQNPVIEQFTWEGTRMRMHELSITQMNLYNTHRWPFFMNQCMVYPSVFQRIVYATVLYYSWFHLASYEYGRTHLPPWYDKTRPGLKQRLNELWSRVIAPLHEAIEILDIDDNVFLPTLQKAIETSTQTKTISKNMLNHLVVNMSVVLYTSLTEIYTPTMSMFTHFRVKKKSASVNIKEMEDNIEAMGKYIRTIKDLIKPMDNMFFIKFVWLELLKDKYLAFLPYYRAYPMSSSYT